MIKPHLILAILWIFYGIFHSLLAGNRAKTAFYGHFGLSGGLYRLFYNGFALLSLAALLWYHSSVKSCLMFSNNLFFRVFALLFMTSGAVFMLLAIAKYFKQLSGIFKENSPPFLETRGMHRFVRHPLYLGTIFFLVGIAIYFPLYKNVMAVLIIIVYTILGALLEEKKLAAHFGEAYKKYQRKVPMIFPGLLRKKGR
jgi:methanethiol S-methyltransferase